MPKSKVRKKKSIKSRKREIKVLKTNSTRVMEVNAIETETNQMPINNNVKHDALRLITQKFSEVCEKYFSVLSGTCYMQGYCLAEVLKLQGYNAKSVTGTLALLMSNTNQKYAMYGDQRYSGELIGNYHTWCEIESENGSIIIDPSSKYNVPFLKKHFKIKIDPRINDDIITMSDNTFLYKYKEDIKLESQSLMFLNFIDKGVLDKIINETCERLLGVV